MIKITWGFKRSHLVRRVDFPHHGCWLLVQILPPWQIGGAAQILFDFSTNMIAMEIFYTYLEGTYPLGIFWNQFKFGWEKYYTTLMSKVWGSNCRKALSLKGTIKKRRKIWMRSWSVVNEGKRSAKTSFGWKRRFVRERPTTARRPSPPRARGDAFICFLMWAGGLTRKGLGSSDDNSAIKRSPGQTCSVTPGQFQMGDLHTCSLLGSSIVLKLESSSYIPSVAISVRLTLLIHNFVISPLISFNLASLPWCKVSAPSSWNATPFIWTFHVRC